MIQFCHKNIPSSNKIFTLF